MVTPVIPDDTIFLVYFRDMSAFDFLVEDVRDYMEMTTKANPKLFFKLSERKTLSNTDPFFEFTIYRKLPGKSDILAMEMNEIAYVIVEKLSMQIWLKKGSTNNFYKTKVFEAFKKLFQAQIMDKVREISGK